MRREKQSEKSAGERPARILMISAIVFLMGSQKYYGFLIDRAALRTPLTAAGVNRYTVCSLPLLKKNKLYGIIKQEYAWGYNEGRISSENRKKLD
ncbi:MAG: hypothetical protein K5705_13035 [Oscillospiraceae bacterium]|nr:hypothetical protein [Oscillospiraceae bacterium]